MAQSTGFRWGFTPLWFCLFEGISYWVPHAASEDRHHSMDMQWVMTSLLVMMFLELVGRIVGPHKTGLRFSFCFHLAHGYNGLHCYCQFSPAVQIPLYPTISPWIFFQDWCCVGHRSPMPSVLCIRMLQSWTGVEPHFVLFIKMWENYWNRNSDDYSVDHGWVGASWL